MKKVISMMLAIMLVCLCGVSVLAEAEPSPEIYVSISDGTGDLVMAYVSVPYTDADGDGTVTINDVLIGAHNEAYEGGAAAGFASIETRYGLSVTKLWGDESGSCGYYVNNVAAMSLADPVSAGDHVKAFIYTDGTAWSDTYSFFDKTAIAAEKGDSVTLTLSSAGYDENGAPVTLPVAGATILVNGQEIDAQTDAEGKVTFVLDQAGNVVISARSAIQTLVPPVCLASVEGGAPIVLTIVIVVAVIAVAAVAVVCVKKKK